MLCRSSRSSSRRLRRCMCAERLDIDADGTDNALRGLCREFGLCIPVGATRVIPAECAQLTNDGRCRSLLHPALETLCAEVLRLEAAIVAIERQLAARRADVRRVRCRPFRGLSLLTASAWSPGSEMQPASRTVDIVSALGPPPVRLVGYAARLGGSANAATLPSSIADQRARSVLCLAKWHRESVLRVWALRTQERRGHIVAAWHSPISSRALSGRSGHDAAICCGVDVNPSHVATRASLPKDSGAMSGAPVGPARGDPETEPGSRS